MPVIQNLYNTMSLENLKSFMSIENLKNLVSIETLKEAISCDSVGCYLGALCVTVASYKLLDYLWRCPRIGSFESRYIFITGCDTGYGNLVAKRLDALGCHVFAACLTEQGEIDLKKSCSNRLHTVPLDVTKHDSVVKAYEYVKKNSPQGLWAIVNNAGIVCPFVPVEWMPLETYVQLFNVNCLGYVDVAKTFLPLIKGKGRVVNVSSGAGRFPGSRLSAYAISKHGVEAFNESLRRELRPFGVTVHAIATGGFNTKFAELDAVTKDIQIAWEQTTPEIRAKYGDKYYKSAMAAVKKFPVSSRLDKVVYAFEHALLARHPRTRYVVGWDLKYLFTPLIWVPATVSDWILSVAL